VQIRTEGPISSEPNEEEKMVHRLQVPIMTSLELELPKTGMRTRGRARSEQETAISASALMTMEKQASFWNSRRINAMKEMRSRMIRFESIAKAAWVTSCVELVLENGRLEKWEQFV
jgi:hypothetical protein